MDMPMIQASPMLKPIRCNRPLTSPGPSTEPHRQIAVVAPAPYDVACQAGRQNEGAATTGIVASEMYAAPAAGKCIGSNGDPSGASATPALATATTRAEILVSRDTTPFMAK